MSQRLIDHLAVAGAPETVAAYVARVLQGALQMHHHQPAADGTVYSHALPYESFSSPEDLARAVLDVFGNDSPSDPHDGHH